MTSIPGGYLWPPITPPQSLPLSNGHHGWNEPHASSLRQGLSNTELDDATSLAAVQTKRYRNSVCAVSKLPPELLSYVFSINIYCDRPGAKNGTSHLGWISVTQVCHYWREVALATPSLWRYLDFISMSRKWCSEMLRRSGNCPIEVALRVTGSSCLYPTMSTSFDVAREFARPEYSARLAGLQLDLSSLARRDVESLIQSIQRSAPLLESLELRQTSWEPMTIGSLASCLPSFKRLALHNVFLSPWVSPIFLNLYELHMNFDRHRLLHLQDILPSYEEVAIILGRMPELRCLTLRNVFAEGSYMDAKRLSGRTISLPKLQNLSLIDQQDCDLLSFASLLDLPPTACAEIKTNGQAWKGISRPASLLSHYERTFGPVRRLKLLANGHHPQVTLEFRVSDALSVENSAPSQLRLDYALPPPPPPPPSTDGQDDDDDALADGKLQSLAPLSSRIAHHFRNATSLRLDGLLYLEIVSHAAAAAAASSSSSAWKSSSPLDDYWWAALFSRATRLQQIRITYRGAVDGFIMGVLLAQAQNSRQDEQRERQPPPPPPPNDDDDCCCCCYPLFPDLRSVKLSLVDLDETVTVAPVCVCAAPPRTRGDMLLDGLARRRELGMGIRRLEVPDHEGRWVRKLREIVPGVTHAEI